MNENLTARNIFDAQVAYEEDVAYWNGIAVEDLADEMSTTLDSYLHHWANASYDKANATARKLAAMTAIYGERTGAF